MTSEERERQHQSRENPVAGFLTGKTLKVLDPFLLFDDELEPVKDEELYAITLKGIFRVED
jgi:hypothetical protein